MKEELLGLVDELPAVYTKVMKMLPTLQTAVNYYKSFVEITCSRWVWLYHCTMIMMVAYTYRKSTSELLPMLCYLNDHGNVTLHQWKTGEAPQVGVSKSNIVDQVAIVGQ